MERFTETVVFPTPPFPDPTATRFLTPGIGSFGGSACVACGLISSILKHSPIPSRRDREVSAHPDRAGNLDVSAAAGDPRDRGRLPALSYALFLSAISFRTLFPATRALCYWPVLQETRKNREIIACVSSLKPNDGFEDRIPT